MNPTAVYYNTDLTSDDLPCEGSIEPETVSINLQSGWNMFGYGCKENNVIDATADYTELIILLKDNNGKVILARIWLEWYWSFNARAWLPN